MCQQSFEHESTHNTPPSYISSNSNKTGLLSPRYFCTQNPTMTIFLFPIHLVSHQHISTNLPVPNLLQNPNKQPLSLCQPLAVSVDVVVGSFASFLTSSFRFQLVFFYSFHQKYLFYLPLSRSNTNIRAVTTTTTTATFTTCLFASV